jgi:hypothetical protein
VGKRAWGMTINYLLCIIALSCFFLAQACMVVAVGMHSVFLLLWVDWLIDFLEEREKEMCQIVGGLQKV